MKYLILALIISACNSAPICKGRYQQEARDDRPYCVEPETCNGTWMTNAKGDSWCEPNHRFQGYK